jgi:hypothetical protein
MGGTSSEVLKLFAENKEASRANVDKQLHDFALIFSTVELLGQAITIMLYDKTVSHYLC